MRHAIADPESPEAFHNAHPSACHARDVQALVGLIVVIVEVQSRRAQVHLNGFFFQAEFGRKHHVDAWTQAAFMDSTGLIELEVFAVGFQVKLVLKKVEPLQGVGLLDVH